MNSELNQSFSAVNQRRCRRKPELEVEDGCVGKEEQDVLTQFLQTQKNHLSDLVVHLET